MSKKTLLVLENVGYLLILAGMFIWLGYHFLLWGPKRFSKMLVDQTRMT
jgi:hypothetical protein